MKDLSGRDAAVSHRFAEEPPGRQRASTQTGPLTTCTGRVILLLLFALLPPVPGRGQPQFIEPAQVLARLQQSVGKPVWNPGQGYRLSGSFVFKASGEDIPYEATYLRLPGRWVVDFHQSEPTLSMRFGFGPSSWAASQEITADAKPGQLPWCAQYDFPLLYAELIRILQTAGRNSGIRIGSDGEGIYVRGKLANGAEATFILTAKDYFPRKVSLAPGVDSPPAWAFPVTEPDGSARLNPLPAAVTGRFELWFSDPIDADGSRYPRRTDYVGEGGVAGSFFLREIGPALESDPLLERPPRLPWADLLHYQPGRETRRSSLYIREGELAEFRSRLRRDPWSDWAQTNALASVWASLAYWLSRFVPSPSSSATLAAVQILLLAAIVVLVRRRRRVYKHTVSWRLWLAASLIWFLILLSGLASIQLKRASSRSLLALHSAIRYAVTGDVLHAQTARLYLSSIPQANPASSVSDLARACEAYSLAYDLASPALARTRQAEIELDLFTYARPLYAALQGWRANTGMITTLAAGLGMTGMATGCPEYLNTALSGMRRGLTQQVEGGLHRDGPGPGADAMDNAANLIYALKRAGKEDLYAHPSFLEYVRTTIQMTSPFGTLPLFGSTSLDQSSGSVSFFLKVADHQPAEIGRQCVAAYESYWSRGRYSVRGMAKLIARWIQPRSALFTNPYVMFQYEHALQPAPPSEASAVLGAGQAAVLKTGAERDSIFLAINTRRSPPFLPDRDILTFDLAAYGGLLLHGPGFPGTGHPALSKSGRTAASNSITFQDTNQSGTQCTGIIVPLLNQPLFDFVRTIADRIYEHGQVQRDVILVRRQKDYPPYVLLVDSVHTIDPETTVQWYLHGGSDMNTGVGLTAKWTSQAFAPPSLRSTGLTLTAHPIAFSGRSVSATGKLYYENQVFNQESKTFMLAWTGSQRFCTVLMPQKPGMAEVRVDSVPGSSAGRIGASDWISLGDIETPRSVGRIRHLSEYVLVRERGLEFPAVLMIGGFEFENGPHAISSSKPLSVSLDGLRGTLRNARPETRVEMRSPTIRAGDRFLLDGKVIEASSNGLLSLSLYEAGEHSLVRDPQTLGTDSSSR